MSYIQSTNTQKQLLLSNLMEFYENEGNINKMLSVINGESKISLRIADWFVTNYAKKYYTIYELPQIEHGEPSKTEKKRFKVFHDYKLKLRSYSKKYFDPFCRWERISIPYNNDNYLETTIGQLNFFKWSIENKIIDYIQEHYQAIEKDMNERSSTAKRKTQMIDTKDDAGKTRKKREELSISACKCIKKEDVKIIVKFN
jgi:hypothetical protein